LTQATTQPHPGPEQPRSLPSPVNLTVPAERPDWPGADTNPALFLNRRSSRLSVRGASAIIADIGRTAGLDEQTTAHILRHSFATTLIRGGTDLVVVAELLGHARLETVRAYTKPTEEDKAKALNLLPVDR
jgi:site-specific recombinase XerD